MCLIEETISKTECIFGRNPLKDMPIRTLFVCPTAWHARQVYKGVQDVVLSRDKNQKPECNKLQTLALHIFSEHFKFLFL